MAAEDDRKGALAFAMVEQVALPIGDLRRSLIAGQRTNTYGRDWVMAEPHDLGDGLVHGHIGIVTEIEAWDPHVREFKPAEVEAGYATPYLLDVEAGRMVFQTRGSTIKAQSFVNAFEHLLNESDLGGWRVRLAEREMEWPQFLAAVDRIDVLSIRLDRPNPRFRSELAEELVDETEAASATVTFRADAEGSIESDSDVVEALMQHAEDYGHTNATGTFAGGGRVRWRSKRRRAQVTAPAPADAETGEVPVDELRTVHDRWSDITFFPGDD